MSTGGHIRPRGPGAWELKYDLGKDPVTGKRRVRYKTVHGRKSDAQRELRNLLGAVDRGVVADAGKMTTKQWLEQWLAECKHTVAPKTWQERDAYVRLHLVPALGTILLAKLTPVHIQNYYSEALTSGRLDGTGGLSAQTVRHHDRVLHTALDRARRLRLIAVNPVDDVDPPRVERAKMITLRPDEQAAILAAAHGSDLYVPTLLALATGLRRGELLGLAWANVDLDTGIVHVLQVIEETKEGARVKPQPKTTHGRRCVTLPQTATDALRQHKTAQAEECLRLGLGKPDLLFPRWASSPAVFGTAFTRMASRIGIKAGVHMLRHTHITDLLAAGAHPKVVSERAGHSSVAFTLERYAHVLPGMQDAAARQVDTALRQALRVANGWHPRGGAAQNR
jgi:integrase